MMRFSLYIPSILALLVLFSAPGCTPKDNPTSDVEVEALRPIYYNKNTLNNIKSSDPRAMVEPGKIYYKDNFIFINEQGKGIHILDNTVPADPKPVSFIEIPGNHDMAIKGNTLYVDNASNLAVIDITDPAAVQVVEIIANAYTVKNYPDETGVMFECVDPAKGAVVGWEKVKMKKPECYR